MQIEELQRLEAAATPGPWYDHNTDDWMCMNIYAVTTCPEEPWLSSPGQYEDKNDYHVVVALTLLQTPRLACHGGQRWEEDARFIAALRNAAPALLRLAAAAAAYKAATERLDGISDAEQAMFRALEELGK